MFVELVCTVAVPVAMTLWLPAGTVNVTVVTSTHVFSVDVATVEPGPTTVTASKSASEGAPTSAAVASVQLVICPSVAFTFVLPEQFTPFAGFSGVYPSVLITAVASPSPIVEEFVHFASLPDVPLPPTPVPVPFCTHFVALGDPSVVST